MTIDAFMAKWGDVNLSKGIYVAEMKADLEEMMKMAVNSSWEAPLSESCIYCNAPLKSIRAKED